MEPDSVSTLAAATAVTAPPSNAAFLDNDPDDMRCYCGKDRDMTVSEFQCGMCLRFYHADCLTCEVGPCVPLMTNYQFFCKRCNASSQESFTKRQASFAQMCFSTVANLLLQNTQRKYFSKDRDIIPFIEKYWEHLTTAPRRVKQNWHSTISKTMMKEVELFTYKEEVSGDPQFGLVNQDLTKIGPNCESLLRLTAAAYKANESKASAADAGKSRGTKRKAQDNLQTGLRAKKGEVLSVTKMAPLSYPVEHPFNKDGYRYILATPDPHAPNRQAFDESSEWAGKPIPGYLYRTFLGSRVLLACHDRAPQLKLSDNRITVTGEKGYSMMRATHGVTHGAWYYEVYIDEMPGDGAARLGWSQHLGNLQAPCGYDKFSYSWRSRKGTRFHQSRGKHYSTEFKEKDVLGFYIYLPPPEQAAKLVPPPYKDKPLIKFKSYLYYEERDHVSEAEKALQVCKGSKMIMYKNGECQGVAFEDIFEGVYYPAVSVYKNCTVTLNFGPDLKYFPTDRPCRPMCERASEAVVEHAMGDILYHVEHRNRQLPLTATAFSTSSTCISSPSSWRSSALL